jgi:hypothetical protein
MANYVCLIQHFALRSSKPKKEGKKSSKLFEKYFQRELATQSWYDNHLKAGSQSLFLYLLMWYVLPFAVWKL